MLSVYYAVCHLQLSVVMLNVVMLNVVMLSVIVLSKEPTHSVRRKV